MTANEIRDCIVSFGFSGRLASIAVKHNCSVEALTSMINEIFKDSVFRYDISLLGKDGKKKND